MTLETIQFPFGDRELPFSHPAEEAEMILSVLGGEDYPLAATRGGSDAPVIIDVGSNCGAAAVFFKKHHPGARIICYEPSASTFELLNKNVGGSMGSRRTSAAFGTRRAHFGCTTLPTHTPGRPRFGPVTTGQATCPVRRSPPGLSAVNWPGLTSRKCASSRSMPRRQRSRFCRKC